VTLGQVIQELQMSRVVSGFCLETVSGPHDGLRFPLVAEEVATLGRGHEATFRLPHDPLVSAQHARIYYHCFCWYILDLASSNGLFVNGRRVLEPKEISPDTEIRVGATQLVVRDAGDGFVWMPL
jgi:pSer/pThr/pTyr-binding forkhead associated (FHA) protein